MEQPHDEKPRWVDDESLALLTDQYQLTMLQAYDAEGLRDNAVFSLFARRLPPARNFLLACGLGTVLDLLEDFHVSEEALEHLESTGLFRSDFLRRLSSLTFTGDVWAVPEGTPVFADEPLLEVVAPIAEAQLLETLVLNQIHVQTLLASKAARIRAAAGDRTLVDFGLRRMHGADAGLKSARAFYVAGVDATSNVLAGRVFGIPVTGTMAHSWIQAHDSELDAFRAFAAVFPETVLLVDTYDTEEGVRNVVRLADELGGDFHIRGIRLDSGDLASLSRRARRILDDAGLDEVRIFASGGLDEIRIQQLLQADAPIDGFGVGTAMGVSNDAPSLDLAYKMTEYAGHGRIKLSRHKGTLPGRKQVFRRDGEDGAAQVDVLACGGESLPGRPLLRRVMAGGRRLPAARETLEDARRRAQREVARLPRRLRGLAPADPAFEVVLSDELSRYRDAVAKAVGGGLAADRDPGGVCS